MNKQPLGLNELSNGRILTRVLGYLVDDIVIFLAISIAKSYYDTNFDKYYDLRDAVQYALVCHRWFDFMRPHICSIIYITGQPAHRFHESYFESTRQGHDYPEPYKLWRSNINAVISMDGVRYTKRLYICAQPHGFPPTFIALLNGYGFGGVMWPNLRDIHVKGISEFSTELSDDDTHIDIAHTYLSKRAPSLGNIHSRSNRVLHTLEAMLSNRWWYLDTTYFQHSTSTYFPQLTSLKLRVGVRDHTDQLVRYFAPTLRELEISMHKLSDIPWQQFTDGGTDTIRFTELTTLKLDFILLPAEPPSSRIPLRISSFYRRETLLFPNLHTLMVNGLPNIYVDFKDVFATAKLRLLDFRKYPDHIPSTSCIPLKCVDILSFYISHFAEFETGLSLVNTITQLFSTYSEVRHANIGVPRLPNITPNWPNLISLELEIGYIDWTRLEAFLRDLSHLRTLKIIQDIELPQYNEQTSLFPTAKRYISTSPHTISHSLEEFTYQTHTSRIDPNVSRFIQQLVERAPSLMAIRASEVDFKGISDSITERGIEIRYTDTYPASTLLHQY